MTNLWCVITFAVSMGSMGAFAATWDPAAKDYTGHKGATLYVSKLGDNSDGKSWATAFNTIQAALDAVPDAQGGHTIVIRPDTYMEGMLSPARSGAAGSYNLLIADVDGRLGSGRTGQAVIDSGDPEKGFKSYDWWGPIRATQQGWSKDHLDPTFSAIIWDRWILRNLYVTGGDGGLFWDCTNRVEPFSIVVEDCVSIGRAFGGGVASCLSRPDEPITFRRCNLWALDWWGDTAGAYIRIENPAMPDRTDVVIDDCTMASPQCALKGGNFGFHTFMRVNVRNSRLITLNFSQPAGTPTDGIIQSVQSGKYLHVDLEDSYLMGYKVFGVRVDKDTAKDIGYTTKGNVSAYVQFQQDVPKGMFRMDHWPSDVFGAIAPPAPKVGSGPKAEVSLVQKDLCEVTPVIWKGKLCLMVCLRPGSGGTAKDYHIILRDVETNQELARFAEGYSLASAYVQNDTVYVFASRFENNNWNDVTLFKSSDLTNWSQSVVVKQDPKEHLFNSSVAACPDGYIMAYETNDPTYPAFTVKFARSTDLEHWTPVTDGVFGTNRYTACPCIRFVNGYYYVMYTEHRTPRWCFEVYITRSKDLKTWETSASNPVLTPSGIEDGIDASDSDLVEFNGKTYLYYSVGDQRTWMNIKRAVYPGSMAAFLESWFAAPGVRDCGDLDGFHARKEKEAQAKRLAWFADAKFGLFVHWGPFAVQGADPNAEFDYFAMKEKPALEKGYEKYAEQFNPKKFDAARWMDAAKSAGMKYVVFTSKHHDGYCLFDSALTNYSSADMAPKRDYIKDLVSAARAANLKIGFYYSTLDWRHPDYSANLPKYVDQYLFGQVRELCANYGPIDCLWFDGEWDHPASVWRAPELTRMIHQLQPGALVNDRLGKGERGVTPLADFYTREQPSEINVTMPFERQKPYVWEACMTIGDSWQYSAKDTKLKSAEDLIRGLVDVVSRGGNLLLNVGPDPDGEIPAALLERLRAIGAWLAVNGESIYGVKRSPFAALPAGKATTKDNRIYIHLDKRPDGPLQLPGLQNTITKAYLLENKAELPFDSKAKTVTLPDAWPNAAVTVVVLELDALPVVQ